MVDDPLAQVDPLTSAQEPVRLAVHVLGLYAALLSYPLLPASRMDLSCHPLTHDLKGLPHNVVHALGPRKGGPFHALEDQNADFRLNGMVEGGGHGCAAPRVGCPPLRRVTKVASPQANPHLRELETKEDAK